MSGPGANKGSLKCVFNGKHGYKYIRYYIVLYCIVGLCICICHWLQIQIQSTIQKSWKQQIQGPPMCVEGMRVMQEMQSSRLVCLAVCKRCRQLQNGLLSFNPGADCKSLELATHQPTAQNRLVRLPNTRGSGTSSMLVRLSPYRSPWKVDASTFHNPCTAKGQCQLSVIKQYLWYCQ